MGNEQDVFTWRRYGHWASSAAKARLSAYVLWRTQSSLQLPELAQECGHTGRDTELGMSEAFRRESAIALELAVKSVLARKLREGGADPAKEGVPATHDLPKLWRDAGLPRLSSSDSYRLQLAKSVLLWAGRYPTPKSAKAWEIETAEFDALTTPLKEKSTIEFRTPITIGWEDFDRLYKMASAQPDILRQSRFGLHFILAQTRPPAKCRLAQTLGV